MFDSSGTSLFSMAAALGFRNPEGQERRNLDRPCRSGSWMRLAVSLLVLLLAANAHPAVAQAGQSGIRLTTSDARLRQSFDWAKSQALAYVSSGQDPVKHWYEAALPGRHAFCMRDVSHQVMGAQALGLAVENRSMLTLFVKGISASRDWASYWEIDRTGKPSPADYVSDQDFWYNLPANFEVISAALRMYMWTGDETYVSSPAFLNFYRRSVTDYLTRWQLNPSNVLERPRILNRHLATGKFVDSRGIPSYTEGRKDFTLGTDLLASEYRALRFYAELQRMNGSAADARKFDRLASGVEDILSHAGWNSAGQHFNGLLTNNGHGFGNGDMFILYCRAAFDSDQRAKALANLRRQTQQASPGVEEQSYRPEILFRYGAPEEAYNQIVDLTRPSRARREYPEVSYAVIGSIVTGMMGMEVLPASDPSGQTTLSRKVVIRTLPRLSRNTSWAQLDQVPVRGNLLSLRQTANRRSTLTNTSGPRLTWRAAFAGSAAFLEVDGKKMRSSSGVTPEGLPMSYVDVPVASGQTVTVSADRK